MINTFIIGSGNLSNSLQKKIIDSKIYTAKEFLKKINLINKKKKNKFNNKFILLINKIKKNKFI
jgi:hypothetical protein